MIILCLFVIFILLILCGFCLRKKVKTCLVNYKEVSSEENYSFYRIALAVSGAIAIISFIIIILNSFNMIKPGEVGIVVDLFGSNKGVENKELTVGVHFIPPWKDIYRFPIFEQNHQWVGEEGFNFQTSEGLSVHADIGITFNLEPSRVHELFSKYRRGMQEITHLFIKNNIRDSVNKIASRMKIEDLYGPKKEEFFKAVHESVLEELKPIGFNISHIFIIGKFGVPEVVMEALNKKIEATQRAQQRENELRESEAQAKKEMAQAEGAGKSKIITAKAEAESLIIEATSKANANNMLARSLTADLLKWQAINKWDGKLPNALGGEGSSFLIDLKK
jgi:regulator of protease activity HflC (stomatin/prohibitin superfamily)